MPILAKKNYLFRWSSFWSWRVSKQAKLLHLGHRKPARIHWKDDGPKTVPILVQRHNWDIFFSKMSKERPLQSMAIVIFLHRNWREGYWQYFASTGRRYVPHSRSYIRCIAPCFWRLHYQPQSWYRLATSELRFDTVGLLFVVCRQRQVLRRQARDINALKDNIREATAEMQHNP